MTSSAQQSQDPSKEISTTERKPRFFFGWVIVIVSCFTNAISNGAGHTSLGVLMRPMSESLGWSRTTITVGASLQSLSNILLTPFLGIILDRYGPRLVMVIGASIAAISYLFLGKVTEPWQFYVFYTAAVSLGLYEVGNFVASTVVSKWFIRRRGRALAFTSLGIDAGAATIAPLTAFLAATTGWRSTWPLLGTLIAATVIPPSALFMRRTPEDMGLRPDGDPPDPPTAQTSAQPSAPRRVETNWTLRQALRTRTLWQLVIALNLSSMGVSALLYHLVAYVMDIGLPLQAASLVVSIHGAGAIGSKLLYGFLAERYPIRYCLGANVAGRAVGYLILLLGRAPWRVYIFAPVGGLLGSAFSSLTAQIWADYYGRASVGTIRGFIAPFSLFSSVTGSLFAAFVFDLLGSYDQVFWVYACALIISSILIFFTKPPNAAPNAAETAAP